MLDHLCEAVTHVCVIVNLHARVQESLHQHFKTYHARGFQIKCSVMNGVVAIQNTKRRVALDVFTDINHVERDIIRISKEARRVDSSVSAYSGVKSSLLTLDSVVFEIERMEMIKLMYMETL